MLPRIEDYGGIRISSNVRGVLTKGIVEYGGLRFLSEGRCQTGEAVSCAHMLAELHGCPFIAGLTAKGVTVAPLSEKDRFLDVASCVVTKSGVWSMTHTLPAGGSHYMDRHAPLIADKPARYSVMIRSPAEHIYCGILESGGLRNFRD